VWKYRGSGRPPFADEPSVGQESVWDYPRPPALRAESRRVVVRFGDEKIAETVAAYRVLETASPPTFYIPPRDIRMELMVDSDDVSFCEWKGSARYWSLQLPNHRLQNIAWGYDHPSSGFEKISGFLSFYPGRVECFVDGERVRPQPGGFYGGWLTNEIKGPVKGSPGSGNW
jgi:uncharacterized protein (DUF427 family)